MKNIFFVKNTRQGRLSGRSPYLIKWTGALIKLNHDKYKKVIKSQKNEQTFSNLASLLCCFEIAKESLLSGKAKKCLTQLIAV
mgnify:CR=1 FL=1